MRLTDLIGAEACDADGKRLGRVCEVFAKAGEVDALGIGMHSLFARLFGRRRGRRIPWTGVIRIEQGRIIVGDE
jgi:sporulation protein YlmC with PRC-barrel domain